MQRYTNILDTSAELVLQRYGNGVKLMRPTQGQQHALLPTVASMLKMPFNVYFVDLNSIIQNINDETIQTCGFSSVKEAIGNTSHVAATKEAANFELNHDRVVIKTNTMTILDENYESLHGHCFSGIAIKFPWYNRNNTIIGVFGCTLQIGNKDKSLAEALALMMQVGLLESTHARTQKQIVTLTVEYHGYYLTEREKDIMQLLLRGKTAKK